MTEDKFHATLRAVGGKEGIVRCLAAGNDAPLDLVLAEARAEIDRLRELLKQSQERKGAGK